ncbi:uncharacterized protein LOC62_04G005278 [Vanrija pseudolonga]|uniref:F-box domain-containing protein n=1 Tax=Vanrija pseudolonga TaxID=143232 RepID=A0AAF0Y899_9TREE|nr:hypothetical protein LOC62_04G005278 [Vanrija pseudolonga]
MDSTAYPHIMESIIAQCSSASTLLALRATSKRWHDLVDARLFYHVVFRAEEYTPKPKSSLQKLFYTFNIKKPTPALRYTMALPASSPIVQDVPQLPLLPRKAHILDLSGPITIYYESTYSFIQLGFSLWSTIPSLKGRALSDGKQPTPYEPVVLRRIGAFVDEDWEGVRDTAVDFLHLGRGPVEVTLPVRAPRYVLHVDWRGAADSRVGLEFRRQPSQYLRMAIPEAFLVLARHSTPLLREVVSDIVVRATMAFMTHMVLGETVLTVVGLESWSPGIDAGEFKHSIREEAIAMYHHRGLGDNAGRLSSRQLSGYEGPRFIMFEEWLGSLGKMKDLVGVWPDSEVDYVEGHVM